MPIGGRGYCYLVKKPVAISEDGCDEQPYSHKNEPGYHVYQPCLKEKH